MLIGFGRERRRTTWRQSVLWSVLPAAILGALACSDRDPGAPPLDDAPGAPRTQCTTSWPPALETSLARVEALAAVGDADAALDQIERIVAAPDSLFDHELEAEAINRYGFGLFRGAQPGERAIAALEEAEQTLTSRGLAPCRGRILHNRGYILLRFGSYPRAEEALSESMRLSRLTGETALSSETVLQWATALGHMGQPKRGIAAIEKTLASCTLCRPDTRRALLLRLADLTSRVDPVRGRARLEDWVSEAQFSKAQVSKAQVSKEGSQEILPLGDRLLELEIRVRLGEPIPEITWRQLTEAVEASSPAPPEAGGGRAAQRQLWARRAHLGFLRAASVDTASRGPWIDAMLGAVDGLRAVQTAAGLEPEFFARRSLYTQAALDHFLAIERHDRAWEVLESMRGGSMLAALGGRPLGLEAARAWVADHEILYLSWWLSDDELLRFSLAPSGDLEVDARAFDRGVTSWRADPLRAEVARAMDRVEELVPSRLPPSRAIWLSPPAELQHLPWTAALSRRPHIEATALSRVTSLSVAQARLEMARASLAEDGAPDPTGSPLWQVFVAPVEDRPSLPGAESEADLLRRRDDAMVVAGTDATCGAFHARSPAEYLHLTGHGLSSTGEALDLRLKDCSLSPRSILEHPVAHELVILAACESGRGRAFRGEGALGFPDAFLQTGTRLVVATLWNLDDAAAADFFALWVEALDEARAQGLAPSWAFREAQRRARTSAIGPETWAAYEVFGSDLDLPLDAGSRTPEQVGNSAGRRSGGWT